MNILIQCAIFLVLLAVFISVEYLLRGDSGRPSFPLFAVLLIISFFCSTLLSHLITERFDDAWETFDPPESENSTVKSSAGSLIENSAGPEEEETIPDEPVPMTPYFDPREDFPSYVVTAQDGSPYYSPENETPVLLLLEEYICEAYAPFSSDTQKESFTLSYPSLELTMDVTISREDCLGFQTLKAYYEHFHEQYRGSTDFYDSFNPNAHMPYYVLSYRSEANIYYEVTYHPEGAWHSIRFSYPTSQKAACNKQMEDYIGKRFLGKS